MSSCSRRQDVIRLYKDLIRLSKTWQAKNAGETSSERVFIRNETRSLFRDNKSIVNSDLIDQKLEEGRKRLEVAKHYGIPYARPVYYPTGAVTGLEKKRLRKK
jgi:hypothetical protein